MKLQGESSFENGSTISKKEASGIALQMSQFSVDELERLLRVNAKIAVENYKRYQAFHAEGTPELPAFIGLYRNCVQTVECKRFLESRI